MMTEMIGFQRPNGRLIDFHTHILPHMDDGSKSTQESLHMIRTEAEHGVFCIAATPHFYAERDNPESFLKKRKERIQTLREVVGSPFPILLEGAEVQYFSGITVMEELPLFCMEKTNLLLLEMPFTSWNSRMMEDVLSLQNRYSIQPIIAHIERYLQYQPTGTLEYLLQNGILIQANASFFMDRLTHRRAIRMVEEGKIHLIGSDCHNMTRRPPKLGECYDVMRAVMGIEGTEAMIRNSLEILYSGRQNMPVK